MENLTKKIQKGGDMVMIISLSSVISDKEKREFLENRIKEYKKIVNPANIN